MGNPDLILPLIETVYDAVLEPQRWNVFLAGLADALGGRSAFLRPVDWQSGQARFMGSGAHRLAERLSSVALVGGISPNLFSPDVLAALSPIVVPIYTLARDNPIELKALVGQFAQASDQFFATLGETLAPVDKPVFAQPETAARGRADVIESLRNEGVGMVRDLRFFETCILPLVENGDKGLKVDVVLNRTWFGDGDEATLRITPTEDVYVYVYDVDMDWNASLIFPNPYAVENHLKAGQTFVFPGEEVKKHGISLTAQLPKGTDVSAEMIRVIASKTPLPEALFDPSKSQTGDSHLHRVSEVNGNGTFLNLMQKLNAADLNWVEDAQAFTIRRH